MKRLAAGAGGLLGRNPFLLFQFFALLNGLSFAILTPLVLPTDAAASLFQQFAIAVLIATLGDAYANILNRKEVSEGAMAWLQRQAWLGLVVALPIGWWLPWVPLTLLYLTLYFSNNLYARDALKRWAYLPFLISLMTFLLTLAFAWQQQAFSPRFIVLAYASLFVIAMGLLMASAGVAIHRRRDHARQGALSDLWTSLFSRSYLMVGQNLFIALSGFFFLPADVVASRLAFSAQNMLRFLNNLPLVRVSAWRGEQRAMLGKLLRLVMAGSILMVPAALAVSFYLGLLGEASPYRWYEMAIFLAVSVVIIFSPHLIVSQGRSHGFGALFAVIVAGGAALVAALLIEPPRLLLAYALLGVACWLTLFLGGGWRQEGAANPKRNQ